MFDVLCILLFHTQTYNIHITHRAHSVHVTLGYWPLDSVIFRIPRRLISWLKLLNFLVPVLECSSPGIPLCSLTFVSGVYLWWNTTLSVRPSLITILNVSAHFYMNITHSLHPFSVFFFFLHQSYSSRGYKSHMNTTEQLSHHRVLPSPVSFNVYFSFIYSCLFPAYWNTSA